MSTASPAAGNWSLKEEIRSYWSVRSETFDQAFGHRIPPGPERDAWLAVLRQHLGAAPLQVLDVACGTGEISGVLAELGHSVTGLDFSEAMVARARAKHAGRSSVRIVLGDAEQILDGDGTYDAVVTRHLVWTLTTPEAALEEWRRVLRPGGRLVIFDGDFVALPWRGRLARRALAIAGRQRTAPAHRDRSLDEQHARIMQGLPFREGLTGAALVDLLARAGFADVRLHSHAPIASAQRRSAGSAEDWLRTWLYDRFVATARRS